MNEIDDGGPAFPADLRLVAHETSGMSLRDWFAGQALAAFTREFEKEQFHSNEGNCVTISEKCYQMADAMLKARGER